MADEAAGFLSRWARRKEQARTGVVPQVPTSEPESRSAASCEVAPIASLPVDHQVPNDEPAIAEPLPTMADVMLLTRESDYTRFVSVGVEEGVKRAAMKKLFSDPHFNIMDGLDTYIDDYGKPDPIPLAALRQMHQSKVLRLFEDDVEDEGKNEKRDEKWEEKKKQEAIQIVDNAVTAQDAQPGSTAIDDDPDMQLQPDDAAGQPGPDPGSRA
jgi:hypothetical protein